MTQGLEDAYLDELSRFVAGASFTDLSGRARERIRWVVRGLSSGNRSGNAGQRDEDPGRHAFTSCGPRRRVGDRYATPGLPRWMRHC
jgi:hypothetical protein